MGCERYLLGFWEKLLKFRWYFYNFLMICTITGRKEVKLYLHFSPKNLPQNINIIMVMSRFWKTFVLFKLFTLLYHSAKMIRLNRTFWTNPAQNYVPLITFAWARRHGNNRKNYAFCSNAHPFDLQLASVSFSYVLKHVDLNNYC